MAVTALREADVRIDAPSNWLLMLEGRVVFEYTALRLGGLRLKRLPQGDGHAVMVLPGFGAGDGATRPLRRLLRRLGYRTYSWRLGRNLGMRDVLWTRLRHRLESIAERSGPVSLVGWSLGGVFARELAREHPELVRRVITLGSPINGRPDANNVTTLFRWWGQHDGSGISWSEFQRRREAPPVPCTAVYTRSDGILAWQCSLEEPASNTDNIEVRASHCGLIFNPAVLRVVARQLAMPTTAHPPVDRSTHRPAA